MKSPKLYPFRLPIVSTVRALPHPWAGDLADRLDRMLLADEKRARHAPASAAKRQAALREKLIAAIDLRLLHHPQCVSKTLERIARAGPAAFGLTDIPDESTVRDAVRDARQRSSTELQAMMLKWQTVTVFRSQAAPAPASFSAIPATT